ncbi:methyltransferase, partial [Thermodesulfobacteriota bacterium]
MKIYEVKSIPIFQNKVYTSPSQAKAVMTSTVSLMHCQHCDFIHNADFDPALITYDENYQNEQANSHFFQ